METKETNKCILMTKNEQKLEIEKFGFRKITKTGEEKGSETVAVEKSYDLLVNKDRIATIMSSPTNLKDLCYGYLLSEGIVKSKEKIQNVEVKNGRIHAFVEDFEKVKKPLELRSSGCIGANLKKRNEEIKVKSDLKIQPEKIFESLKHIDSEIYDLTSGVHSASLIDKQGNVLAKATDVGRHNTYDKVIGKSIFQPHKLSETILFSSGRQSAGMVSKAGRVGIPIIVSKGAPISLGIKAAKEMELTLICFADERKFKIFTNADRVIR